MGTHLYSLKSNLQTLKFKRMTVLSVESLEDYEKYLAEAKTDQVVLIDFYATWCPPCRAIAPYLDELSNEHVDILFLKVDVDKVKDVAKKEAINCMPTFVCYVNQTQTAKLEGADKQQIKDVIDNNGIATPTTVKPKLHPNRHVGLPSDLLLLPERTLQTMGRVCTKYVKLTNTDSTAVKNQSSRKIVATSCNK